MLGSSLNCSLAAWTCSLPSSTVCAKHIIAATTQYVLGEYVRRVVSCWLVLLMCSMSPLFVVKEGRAQSATVGFSPSTVVLGPGYCVGETFALAARIDDFTGLYGMGLKIEWNTTYLDYVEHVVKVPVETYPDGLLHRPIVIVKDFVDEAGAYTNLLPLHFLQLQLSMVVG